MARRSVSVFLGLVGLACEAAPIIGLPGQSDEPDAGAPVLDARVPDAAIDPDAAIEPAIQPEEYCRRESQIASQKYAQCFGGEAAEWTWPDFLAGCLRDGQSVEAGRQRFNAQAARDCLRRFEQVGCEELFADPPRSWTCSAEPIFTPGVPPGGACVEDWDCDLGSACDNAQFDSGQCSRTCVAIHVLQEGASCGPGVAWTDHCGFGLGCARSGVCRPLAGLGGSCADVSCREGMCNRDTEVCERRRLEGESCTRGVPDPCVGYNVECAPGPEGTCRVGRRLHEQCEPGLRQCSWPMLCAVQTDGTARCQRPPRQGERCNEAAPEPVGCEDSHCSSATVPGVCFPQAPIGGACEEHVACEEFLCVDGICERWWSCP